MSFVKLTRPDKATVHVNIKEIVSFAPAVPSTSPPGAVTRLVLRTGNQDVTEKAEEVAALIGKKS